MHRSKLHLRVALCSWAWLCLSCARLLGLSEGKPYPLECDSNADCHAADRCEQNQCTSRACREPGERDCEGLTERVCGSDRVWSDRTCDALCLRDSCQPTRSCDVGFKCGAEGESCCKADFVPGGEFDWKYELIRGVGDAGIASQPEVQRNIPRFALDRFEVTIGRFRRFVAGYSASRHPPDGAGAYLELPGSGWDARWNDNPGFIPSTQAGLEDMLRRGEQSLDPDVDPTLPVRGVNWYVAQAFCIWDDGARLPTEAEWQLAAATADQREFPWEDVDMRSPIDHDHAQYGAGEPAPVGSKHRGAGKYSTEDLAGNLSEWVLDGYRPQLTASPCADPAAVDAANQWACLEWKDDAERVLRGGSFTDNETKLANVKRTSAPGYVIRPTIGFRCARSLDPKD